MNNAAFLALALCATLFSCSFFDEEPSLGSASQTERTREKWTIVVYMAADNNLESAAISDLNELESASDFFRTDSNVLVLLDRCAGYDATNGDWSDTRLFCVTEDKSSAQSHIVSERLSCAELGLSEDEETELDMADGKTLSGLLRFARRKYPAEHFALIIWGHGTGWRGEGKAADSVGAFRAVAVDERSDSYMTISELRKAVDDGMGGGTLDFIGFDTCFSSCAELAYELRSSAKVLAGTPSLVSGEGWDYTGVLNDFSQTDMTVSRLCAAVSERFKKSYSSYAYAAFSVIDLAKIGAAVRRFDEFASLAASRIETEAERDFYYELLTKRVRAYCDTVYPCDYFVDMADAARKVAAHDESLSESAESLSDALDACFISSWSADGEPSSLGVFYAQFDAAESPSHAHSSQYVNNSRDVEQGQFVRACAGYVPTAANEGSLLDKVFYTTFSGR